MPTTEEIAEIKSLASEGHSVNKIKEELDIPKSTVYYHFKKEVGQKQKSRAPKIPEDKEFKGELCGIFAGDGNYRKTEDDQYKTRFTLNSEESYWRDLKNYLREETGRAPHVHQRKNSNTVDLLYGFKSFYDLYGTYLDWEGEDKSATIRLRGQEDFSDEFKRGFLRGLLDTDGSLHQERYIFTTISEELAQNIKHLLQDQGFDSILQKYEDKRENRSTLYNVKVSREHAEKFFSQIKPRHPTKQL